MGCLATYVQWVVEFRGLCVKNGIDSKIFERASNAEPDVADIERLRRDRQKREMALRDLARCLGWAEKHLEDCALEQIRLRAESIADNIAQGPQLAAFENVNVTVQDALARELLRVVLSSDAAFWDLSVAVLRVFYAKWLSHVVQERQPLARF